MFYLISWQGSSLCQKDAKDLLSLFWILFNVLREDWFPELCGSLFRFRRMGDMKDGDTYQEELLDYEEEEEAAPDAVTAKANGGKK